MGLEVDDMPEDNGPPIFTGEALNIRFPDVDVMQPNGKMKLQSVSVVCFPHWIYKVNINNVTYDLRGTELQPGMFIELKDKLLLIMDITKVLYHGMEIPAVPIARPPKPEDSQNLLDVKFTRLFFDDGHIEWKIEPTK